MNDHKDASRCGAVADVWGRRIADICQASGGGRTFGVQSLRQGAQRMERVLVAGPEVLLSQLALSEAADCTYFFSFRTTAAAWRAKASSDRQSSLVRNRTEQGLLTQ
ncbi:MAG: hypothetical protein PHH58_07015 [Rhodoferax sp.]|nr:hypothetical protein [Rhodoferax sp.]